MNKRFSDRETIVQSTSQAFRDDFPGSTLASFWGTPVTVGAATATVGASTLVLTLPATTGASVTVTGRIPFSIPCRLSASLLLSARSTNQNIIVELVSDSWIQSAGTAGHYARWKFDGTTATTSKTQTRNTDTAGTETSRTIVTTAAVPRIYSIDLGYDDVRFSQNDVDSVAARGAVFSHTAKVPDAEDNYYIRVSATNTGASSALTATFDFIAVQDVTEVMAEISSGTGFNTISHAMPVNVVAAVTGVVVGLAAHDAGISGNPVRLGARAVMSNYTSVGTGDVADLISTCCGALIVKPFSIPEADWSYAAAAGGIVNTSDVVAKAAGAAGIKNYITSFQLRNTAVVATEFVIKDGSTVIWRGQLPATMVGSEDVVLQTPLKGTAATAINVACITTSAAVYFNCQGYQAP